MTNRSMRCHNEPLCTVPPPIRQGCGSLRDVAGIQILLQTEGAYRVILSIKNEDTRTDALSYVSECLHNGEKVTDRDLRGWLKVWKIEHGEPEPEKLTNVNPVTPGIDVKPETPILSLAQQQAEKHINPGPAVMVNPVIINDTYRESPFKTAAEVLAHDKDPLGVDEMFRKPEPEPAKPA